MINSLHIKNFRSIKDVSLDSLGKINLIIGPNSSGKSSLLQSIFMFCVDANPNGLLPLAVPETDDTDVESTEKAFQWLFHAEQRKYAKHIQIAGVIDGVPRQASLRKLPKDYYSGKSDAQFEQVQQRANDDELSSSFSIEDVRLGAFAAYEFDVSHGDMNRLGRVYFSIAHGIIAESKPAKTPEILASLTKSMTNPRENIAKLFDTIQNQGDHQKVIQMLQTIDDGIQDIKIGVGADDSPVVRVVHRDLGIVPVNLIGDGFAIALRFALETLRPMQCKIIDEFDASLHVNTISTMAKYLVGRTDSGMQLFLTTHRGDTVEAFLDLAKAGWDGLTVIQMRQENGISSAKIYSGEYLLNAWGDLQIDLRVPS